MKENLPLDKYKLIILLGDLNEKEFKELGLWLHSPFLNKSKIATKLYEVFKEKYYKKNKPIKPVELMRYMDIIPQTIAEKEVSPKHRQDLKRAMHKLTAQILDFLAWNKMQEDEMHFQFCLAEALREKKRYKLVKATLDKTRKIHEKSPLRHIKYCQNDFRLAEADFVMNIILQNRNIDSTPENAVEALRISCLSQLLRYYCVVVNTGKVVKTDSSYPFMEVVKQYVKGSKDLDNFTVWIYYTLLKLLEEEQIEDYDKLKKCLLENPTIFDAYELRQLFSFMSNYCTRMISKGNVRFEQEKFDLYDISLESKCWTDGVYFSIHYFVQIVKTALQLDEIVWAGSFLHEYGNSLPPDLKDNISNYCYALLAFKNKDYETAHKRLIGFNSEDFAYHLEIEILLIKIFYDNKTVHNIKKKFINNRIKSIGKYVLRKNKVAETTRQQYDNFINFFNRIFIQKKKHLQKKELNKKSLNTLESDLSKLKPLIERTWLEEKLEELIRECS